MKKANRSSVICNMNASVSEARVKSLGLGRDARRLFIMQSKFMANVASGYLGRCYMCFQVLMVMGKVI